MQLLMIPEDFEIQFTLMNDKGKIVSLFIPNNDEIERLLDLFEGYKQHNQGRKHKPYHCVYVLSNQDGHFLQFVAKDEHLFWNLFDERNKLDSAEIKAVDETIEYLYDYYID